MPRQQCQRNRTPISLLRLVGSIWTAPNTLLGMLLGLAGQTRWNLRHQTVEIRFDSGPVLWVCRNLGISAFTVGDCVLYAVAPTTRIRLHEHRHCMQYWVLGPFFLPLYFVLLGLYGYFNHPFERDARRFEEKMMKLS